MSTITEVLSEVVAEMAAGVRKHGPLGTCAGRPIPSAPSERLRALAGGLEVIARLDLDEAPTVAAILAEEVGEALQATNEQHRRAELIQVAAVAIRWVALIDGGPR